MSQTKFWYHEIKSVVTESNLMSQNPFWCHRINSDFTQLILMSEPNLMTSDFQFKHN